MVNRRSVLTTAIAGAALAASPFAAQAQSRKDTMVLGMALEPAPGLDPTTGAAAAIAEITLYNIFETLTKINGDGSVTPLLAEKWEVSPDLKTYTFFLRKGVKFQNGEPFNAQAVKFSFDRSGGEKSTNKDKRTYANLTTQVIDDHTVVLINKEIDPNLPFTLGQATAALVELDGGGDGLVLFELLLLGVGHFGILDALPQERRRVRYDLERDEVLAEDDVGQLARVGGLQVAGDLVLAEAVPEGVAEQHHQHEAGERGERPVVSADALGALHRRPGEHEHRHDEAKDIEDGEDRAGHAGPPRAGDEGTYRPEGDERQGDEGDDRGRVVTDGRDEVVQRDGAGPGDGDRDEEHEDADGAEDEETPLTGRIAAGRPWGDRLGLARHGHGLLPGERRCSWITPWLTPGGPTNRPRRHEMSEISDSGRPAATLGPHGTQLRGGTT